MTLKVFDNTPGSSSFCPLFLLFLTRITDNKHMEETVTPDSMLIIMIHLCSLVPENEKAQKETVSHMSIHVGIYTDVIPHHTSIVAVISNLYTSIHISTLFAKAYCNMIC